MMKSILSREQIYKLVSKNKYLIDPKEKFLSRCIDGRYPTSPPNRRVRGASQNIQLPALAFPGADVGELALIQATANAYGFEINLEKAFTTLITIVGGVVNFGMHSDHHGDPQKAAAGCGHWKQINLDPAAYQLEKQQINEIQKQLDQLDKNKVNQVVLEGDHLEGAILIIWGNWGVFPRYKMDFDYGSTEVQVFVYHQTLVDERHQALASAWLKNKAVKLYNGCDENYLYQAISEMAENHLLETAKRLAKGLPIYEVRFENDGGFEIKEVGKV